jgi:hypothetical protein
LRYGTVEQLLRRRSESELLWISSRAETLRVRRTAAERKRRRGLAAGKAPWTSKTALDSGRSFT